MYTLQKAGAHALIFGVKCLRQALSTLADLQDGGQPSRSAEIRALRTEIDAVNASLRQIKATLGTDVRPLPDQRLQ